MDKYFCEALAEVMEYIKAKFNDTEASNKIDALLKELRPYKRVQDDPKKKKGIK